MRSASAARPRTTAVVAVGVGLSLAMALSGCTGAPTAPAAPTASSTATVSPTAVPTQDPTLRPQLGAAENRAYFDFVNAKTIAANPEPTGRSFIDALVAAGFNKADMLVTADKTTIDLTPGSIQFSVRFNGACLIGQYGQDGVGYHSAVDALLATGNCLVGETSPINW
jgi:hypothetical protein